MSKGAFNFPMTQASNFQMVRNQNNMSEPDYIYYNAQIINNSTKTESKLQDPTIDYIDTRIRAVVPEVSKYTVSVENFNIDGAGKNLPLFIPQIRQYEGNSTTVLNRNPNDTIYDITFTWQYGGSKESPVSVYQSTRTVQWIAENEAPWASRPLPLGEYQYPQPEIPYYYCYTYSHWLKLVNDALACAWQDVKLAVAAGSPGTLFGTECPFYTYDKVTNLFSLWQDSNTCVTPYGYPVSSGPFSPTNAPNPLDVFGPSTAEGYAKGEFAFVGYNTNFEGLFTNFNTKYYSSKTLYAPVGYSFSHPIGNEGCEVDTDPQVESGNVTSFVDDSMVISWNGTPNPVPSTNWKFELPLFSTTNVTPTIGSSYTFYLDGNPVAQYLYPPILLNGLSDKFSVFIQGSVVSYTQATGALVLNISTVSPRSSPGENWTFTLPPLVSNTTADPNKGEPVTLAVDQSPSVNLIYEGTAVDVTGSNASNNFSGTVETYELSLNYNGVTGLDTAPDGFKYTTTSPGPIGHFNPIVSFTAQDGVFEVGDSVVGSSSAASGKVVQVLAGNSNRTNTISINNLTAPFSIGDVIGIENQVVGVGTVVSIAGPNEGNASNVPTVVLTVSGQKNPFQINDRVYVGNPTNPIATGKILNVTGANTGYATVGFTNLQNQFGPREQVVNVSQLGSGEIISVQGQNTGYATITYINAQADGAGSKFIVGEYLLANSKVFAQVIIDNTDAVDANGQGNQGNLTARILNPLDWDGTGTPVGLPPSPGTSFAGTQSGTQADFGGVAYLESGTLTLGKINGTAWSVDNQLISTLGTNTTTANVTNFSYTEGSQLVVEVLTGNFQLNDVIYGASQSEPVLFVIQNVDLPNQWNNGDILSWGGGSGTCQISMIQEVFGNTIYAIVGQVVGNYPQYNEEIFNTTSSPVITLNLSNLVGGFVAGDIVTNNVGGATASVAWVGNTNPDVPTQNVMVIKDLSNPTGFNAGGHIIGNSSGLFLPIDADGWSWNYGGRLFKANRAVPKQYNILSFGTSQGESGGTVSTTFGNDMFLYPFVGGGATGSIVRTKIPSTPSDPIYNPNFQVLQIMNVEGPLNTGDQLVGQNGSIGFVDRVENLQGITLIFLYDCNFLFVKDDPITVIGSNTRVGWRSNGRAQSTILQASLRTNSSTYPSEADITVRSLTLSSGFSAGITDSLPNAQIQTVLPVQPTTSANTVLTVENIVGSFPAGATIVDRTNNAKAQIMSNVFQPGAMIVEPISGQFTVLDRILDVKSGGSANFVAKYLQEIVVNPTDLPSGPSALVTDDNGSYLSLEGVVGTFTVGQVFTVMGPAGNPYIGATGTVSQIPNFEIGKKLWGFGGQPTPSYLADAIVVNDTGSGGSAGILTLQNVKSDSEYAWRADDYVRQFWAENGETGGAYTQATITSPPYDFNLTIIPNNDAAAGFAWLISPSTLTSSTLATPTPDGNSTLTTNLSVNEVVFYPGDTLKVTEYVPVLPTSPVYLPENVVQVDLSAGNGVIQTLQSIFPSSPNMGTTYVVLAQDYESTSSLWSPVASIVLATTFIPVREEYTGNPIILGSGNNGTQGNVTAGNFQKDLIETPLQDILPQTGYRGILQYQKRVKTYTSLSLSNDDLKNLDIHFYWRNRLTNQLVPLTLFNGGSTNVRLMFKKIRD